MAAPFSSVFSNILLITCVPYQHTFKVELMSNLISELPPHLQSQTKFLKITTKNVSLLWKFPLKTTSSQDLLCPIFSPEILSLVSYSTEEVLL